MTSMIFSRVLVRVIGFHATILDTIFIGNVGRVIRHQPASWNYRDIKWQDSLVTSTKNLQKRWDFTLILLLHRVEVNRVTLNAMKDLWCIFPPII